MVESHLGRVESLPPFLIKQKTDISVAMEIFVNELGQGCTYILDISGLKGKLVRLQTRGFVNFISQDDGRSDSFPYIFIKNTK